MDERVFASVHVSSRTPITAGRVAAALAAVTVLSPRAAHADFAAPVSWLSATQPVEFAVAAAIAVAASLSALGLLSRMSRETTDLERREADRESSEDGDGPS